MTKELFKEEVEELYNSNMELSKEIDAEISKIVDLYKDNKDVLLLETKIYLTEQVCLERISDYLCGVPEQFYHKERIPEGLIFETYIRYNNYPESIYRYVRYKE